MRERLLLTPNEFCEGCFNFGVGRGLATVDRSDCRVDDT